MAPQRKKPHTSFDYAQTAMLFAQLADDITPAEHEPYRDARRLIVYHLRTAATSARQIAEQMAQLESIGSDAQPAAPRPAAK